MYHTCDYDFDILRASHVRRDPETFRKRPGRLRDRICTSLRKIYLAETLEIIIEFTKAVQETKL